MAVGSPNGRAAGIATASAVGDRGGRAGERRRADRRGRRVRGLRAPAGRRPGAARQRGLLGRLEERGVELELTEAAAELLAREGYDPAYGARPLKRLVQRRIENPLAQRILAGEVRDGDRVVVDAAGDELTFATAEAAVR